MIDSQRGAVSPSPSPGQVFAVPFMHRLLFTHDIFGSIERSVLASVLEPSGELAPKVQFWIDAQVLAAQPALLRSIDAFFASQSGRLQNAGVHTIVGGEAVKNDWAHVERMLATINESDLDRRSYMVVIGGGAVLDAVGFAAGTAHRGIRLVRLPTTTLGQADSGVGVKNAVNRFGKKNWLGTFAVPWAVINDTTLLASLPDRDFAAGFSEAVKVSLLKSSIAFAGLHRDAARIRNREPAVVLPALRNSAEMHLRHITSGGDPFEALEARPLDYGHWSAHRLEGMTNFGVRHGEAVSIGVAIDSVYSSHKHGLPSRDAERILQTLLNLGLPIDHPALDDSDALFAGLEEFRQHLGGRLTLTMLHRIGDPLEVHEVDTAAMGRAIRHVRQVAQAHARDTHAVAGATA